MIPDRGFSTDDFQRRCKALQGAMEVRELDALLLSTEADVRYVTGFLTRFWESPTRPWFVVLPVAGDPVAVIPGIGAELMGKTWLRDIRTWAAPDLFDDGVSLLAATLRELVPERGRIGLPMGHETHLRMPLADYARLGAQLGARAFKDATEVVRRVREVKSPAEIARIRQICAIAGRAFDLVPEFARTGRPLDGIFRDFQIALLSEGADWVPYVAGGAGAGGYGDVISPATAAPLAAGDVLMLDTGAVRDGYFCDFDRNFSVGQPDTATRTAQEVLFEATEAGFEAARPGATAADVHAAMLAVIARSGDAGAGGRLGHGLGLQLTEWPSLIATDHTPLRPGMVLTLEPGFQIAPGRLIVHEEDIVIGETGAEYLSPRAPRRMPILD